MKSMILLALVVVGCTASAESPTSSPSPTTSPSTPPSASRPSSPSTPATPASNVPSELVGTWTAGRGGTTVSYDAITGTSTPSNATGLAYRFAADGTFAKAFRDSNGGSCPMIVLATESGSVAWESSRLELHSQHGSTRTWSSCTPSAATEQTMSEPDLDRGAYDFQLDGEELVLTRTSDGASARFRRSE